MPLQFNQVPSNLLVPFVAVEFDGSKAVQGAATKPYRALLIGQILAAGTANELELNRLYSADDAAALFGKGSQLYEMAVGWFKQGRTIETWAIGLDDDAGGTAATKTATFTGPATAAGTVYLYVGGKRLQVGVSSGDSATTIAAAAAAIVNADTLLPVTAGSAAGVLTLTARHKGTIGNDIDVRLNYNAGEALPLGVGCTIAAGVTGATDPDLSTVWPALGEVQYDVLVLPLSDTTSLGTADDELESRWGPLRPIDGFAFAAKRASLAALSSAGDAENSKHISLMGMQAPPTSPWVIAASVAGQVAASGSNDPAQPFQTLPLVGVAAPAEADRFDLLERNQLLFDGVSTYDVSNDGTVRINRLVSLYKLNALGAEDASFRDVNTHLTLGLLRWSMRNRIALRFPRKKLGKDSDVLAAGVVTPSIVRAELIALFSEWQAQGWVEDLEQFQAELVVEINATDQNRLDVLMPPNLINQLRVTAARMEFRL